MHARMQNRGPSRQGSPSCLLRTHRARESLHTSGPTPNFEKGCRGRHRHPFQQAWQQPQQGSIRTQVCQAPSFISKHGGTLELTLHACCAQTSNSRPSLACLHRCWSTSCSSCKFPASPAAHARKFGPCTRLLDSCSGCLPGATWHAYAWCHAWPSLSVQHMWASVPPATGPPHAGACNS